MILENLTGVPFLVAGFLYGAGLGLTEALHLRVKDIDFRNESNHRAATVSARKNA